MKYSAVSCGRVTLFKRYILKTQTNWSFSRIILIFTSPMIVYSSVSWDQGMELQLKQTNLPMTFSFPLPDEFLFYSEKTTTCLISKSQIICQNWVTFTESGSCVAIHWISKLHGDFGSFPLPTIQCALKSHFNCWSFSSQLSFSPICELKYCGEDDVNQWMLPWWLETHMENVLETSVMGEEIHMPRQQGFGYFVASGE